MGSASPSICAGRSMLRPYEETATARRMGSISPGVCAGRSGATPLRRNCDGETDGRRRAEGFRRAFVAGLNCGD
jgi:hypothetical protein